MYIICITVQCWCVALDGIAKFEFILKCVCCQCSNYYNGGLVLGGAVLCDCVIVGIYCIDYKICDHLSPVMLVLLVTCGVHFPRVL